VFSISIAYVCEYELLIIPRKRQFTLLNFLEVYPFIYT
jgi:hypothetical protein